jgi:hypothetical protein
MASKRFKKLMVVMMKLLIFIFLKVQANDLARISFPPFSPPIKLHRFSELDKVQIINLAPTSFRPSSVPIMYPHSFELDEVQGTMHTCVVDVIQFCDISWQHTYKYGFCLLQGYEHCLHQHGPSIVEESLRWLEYCQRHARRNLKSCYSYRTRDLSKKHSSIVYSYIP